ncbi:MAG: histidine phosphatase family protein [Parachlamydiales bacterium]|nr:histidine phosphatase family protein [Verrucomicrobiota bacterium]MBX3719790.1 histidine phosphatase family protein [Candidatus Acheromyda pituitae]
MNYPTRKIYLIRHGETEWTLTGQHTGTTDLPLTENGREQAALLSKRLKGHAFERVFISPLKRASETCELAGLYRHAEIDPDLAEWNYGDYEGLKTDEIWKKEAHWNIFLRGAPNGESIEDIAVRTNRILMKINNFHGDIALFSHGHFLRALTARWLKLPISDGNLLALSPASISILGFERDHHVIRLWNDINHL